jgi:hypothetical protein
VSALADYLDARLRLIHEWNSEGCSEEAVAKGLGLEKEVVRLLTRLRADPPSIGSTRYRLLETEKKYAALREYVGFLRSEIAALEGFGPRRQDWGGM